MSDTHNAPGGDSAPAPIASTPADTSPITASEAGRALAQRRFDKAKEQQAAPAAAPPEPAAEAAPQELSDEDNAAQPETVDPGETREAEPADNLPPIEPPRSWTKDEKDRFNTYPRELQAYLSEREQERDRNLRQSQNEAAEQRKAIEAEKQQAEKVRQEYEARLPAIAQFLQEQTAGQFADIRTQADVNMLAEEDPLRYLKWDAHQKQVSALQQEMNAAQERQSKDWQTKWAEFAQREDKLISERIPELADPAQRAKVQEGAISYLKDSGFTEQELGSAWNGQASLSLRDHRVQGMIRDAVKYREGQEAARKAITAKPLPPVQRPGVAVPRGNDANIQSLSKKLETTGKIEDAAAVVAARRAAASR